MEHWREGGEREEEGKSEEKAEGGMNSEASRAELSWK